VAKTPEGLVKAAVNKVLANYPETYVFMSVPSGYGKSTLDYLVCHYGEFISIETKKPKAVPTPRQEDMIWDIQTARGMHFTIDGADKCSPLASYLEQVKQNATVCRQPQTPPRRRALRGKHKEPFPDREAYLARWWAAHLATASADRDFSPAQDGLRRPEPDPDAL
jgi:hypothetical protein